MWIRFKNVSNVVKYVELKVEAKVSVCDPDMGYNKFCTDPAVITRAEYEVKKVGSGLDYQYALNLDDNLVVNGFIPGETPFHGDC